MFATVINAVCVAIASIIGVLFKNKINEKYTSAILTGLAIVVGIIGVTYAIETEDILGIIICMALGTLLGEILRIEDHLENFGDRLKARFEKGDGKNSSFTQSFVAGSLLFCIGPMAILGSLQAGTVGDATIILSKTVIDSVAALSFAVAMGIGVIFSGVSVLIYQGIITLLAVWISPFLGDSIITEMSAAGGILMIGIAINMLGMRKEKIRVGNMLPALFLPILYQPLAQWLTALF